MLESLKMGVSENKGLHGPLLGGSGDLVSILRSPISHIVTPTIPVITILAKSP